MMDRAGRSPDSQSPQSTKRQKRSSVACRRCHSQKIKCSGGNPCKACASAAKASNCTYPFRDRKVSVPEHYLKQLEADSRALKHGDIAPSPVRPDRLEDVDPSLKESMVGTPDADAIDPLFDIRRVQPSTQMVTEPPFIGEAACDAFCERLLQSLDHNGDVSSLPATPKYTRNDLDGRASSIDYSLPDRIHAKLLLQVAKRFVGNGQHLYTKSFLEEVEGVYQKEAEPSGMWLCKFFVLLALGELYLNRQRRSAKNDSGRLPGQDHFDTAVNMLQEHYEEATTLDVEVHTLLACFLNVLGRARSAYTYSGVAMRLAVTLGIHRSTSSIHMSAVEREFRRRIWWSLYLFDRLTCSKLGQPVAVKDDDIDVEFPTNDGLTPQEQEEFSDPRHLCASVGLARIAGDIISDIYCLSGRKTTPLVQRVHRILSSLRQWDATLPEDLSFRPQDSNRHVASLHLCYNQCIIQTTRPILLHLFRTQFHLQASHSSNLSPTRRQAKPKPPAISHFSPATTALAEACVNAAHTSNRILSKLFVDGTLATLGYWDAHYLFSSTLVLIMSAVMEPSVSVSDAVQTAFSLLLSMRDDGNIPASDYCARLSIIQTSVSKLGKQGSIGVHAENSTSIEVSTTAASAPVTATTLATQVEHEGQLATSDWARNSLHPTGLDGCSLDDLDALANPYIDHFLAEDSFTWATTTFPDGSTMQQFADELGDSFGLGEPDGPLI